MNIYNNFGEILFSSINRKYKEDTQSSSGKHKYTLWIPNYIFSTGQFMVGIILSTFSHSNSERLVKTINHLTFEVNDKSLNEIVGESNGKMESFLRPQFEWKYEKVNSNRNY